MTTTGTQPCGCAYHERYDARLMASLGRIEALLRRQAGPVRRPSLHIAGDPAPAAAEQLAEVIPLAARR